jgi:pyruvate dehydrogenase E2 component (dihydrolipoamide acetyltransferase)
MADIVMPRLSDTMEEGTILRWLKRNGEPVSRGEELVEIETDKATMTYESDQQGVLEIVAEVGSTLEVGALIARVGETRETTDDEPAGERIKASPLARRMALEAGIDLTNLAGSGPGGRIVKADVLSSPDAATETAAPPAGGPTDVTTAKGETTTVELSRTQQTIARRMAESKATIPDFTLQIDVDMEECVKLRAQLKQISSHAGAPEQSAPEPSASDASRRERLKAPTFNDMVVKACALALREHPTANGSYRDGRLQLHSRVNVGVAVAAASSPASSPEGEGERKNALVVPTVFDADEKSLGEIARETHTLAERVRAGTITPPELGGGTFTVSNLGMYGVRSFTAIVNPPQAGILSVGALAPRAVVVAGGGASRAGGVELVARSTLTLTLACDHRILYGAEAAQFLARIRELLETPSALTL